MNPILQTEAATLSPIALFMEADWVVKAVMLGLLLASIWTWAIIIGFSLKLGRTRQRTEAFERDFWKAEDIDAFYATTEALAPEDIADGITYMVTRPPHASIGELWIMPTDQV